MFDPPMLLAEWRRGKPVSIVGATELETVAEGDVRGTDEDGEASTEGALILQDRLD
jgi:hypothetical protein